MYILQKINILGKGSGERERLKKDDVTHFILSEGKNFS